MASAFAIERERGLACRSLDALSTCKLSESASGRRCEPIFRAHWAPKAAFSFSRGFKRLASRATRSKNESHKADLG